MKVVTQKERERGREKGREEGRERGSCSAREGQGPKDETGWSARGIALGSAMSAALNANGLHGGCVLDVVRPM